jgi:hypothetical protein
MKEYSQMLRLISVLMIFILLPYLSGCISTKVISKSDLPFPDSSKYHQYPYVIHGDTSKFMLEEPAISNSILSGAIKQVHKYYPSKKKIHLYLSSDSMIKLNQGEFLSVPLEAITKVELKIPNAEKTAIAVVLSVCIGVGITALVIYGIVAFFSLFLETAE